MYILKSWYVYRAGPAAIIVTVFKAFYSCRDRKSFVMIHQVAAYLVTAIAKPVGKTIGNGVEQYECGSHRCRI